jgi:hypothetical protein
MLVEKLINFQYSILTNNIYFQIFHQIFYFPFKKIPKFYFIFEDFHISENNIISVGLVKLLW